MFKIEISIDLSVNQVVSRIDQELIAWEGWWGVHTNPFEIRIWSIDLDDIEKVIALAKYLETTKLIYSLSITKSD